MLSLPLSYAAEFWRRCHRPTLIGRLSLISTLVYGAVLVRHLVLSTLFYDTAHSQPQHSPYLHEDDLRHDEKAEREYLERLSKFTTPKKQMIMDYDADASSSRPQRSRKQRPNSIAVDTVLINGASNARKPPPAEHLPGSPSHKLSFDSPASASPTKFSHMRSKSVMDSPRRLNRLSMSFPVLPPNSASSRPTSWANSPVVSPTEPSPATAEGNFLTQLASQERKVLELREALRQAEVELDRLKRHWASHEALKKRAEVRRVQTLQPLSHNLSSLETSEDDVDGSSQWMQKEMERRKALLTGIKSSNRKVFSGSKHTRTLSLLSPDKSNFTQPFPQPGDLRSSEENPYRSPTHTTQPGLNPREEALSQLEGQPKDIILKTGKQMVGDIKDGLWTFFEDIRQATIGEEATLTPDANNTPTAATTRPKGTLKRSNTTGAATARNAKASAAKAKSRDTRHDTLIDIGGSFWREHGVETPVPASKSHSQSQAQHANSKSVSLKTSKQQPSSKKNATPTPSGDFDESWDSWDTPGKETSTPVPAPKKRQESVVSDSSSDQADSASDGIGTPLTDEHSKQTPRTSTSSSKRNSIPWPDLEKLTPSSLKRTASHLMKEWERSMTPSPSASEVEGLAYDTTPSAAFGSSTMSSKTDKSD